MGKILFLPILAIILTIKKELEEKKMENENTNKKEQLETIDKIQDRILALVDEGKIQVPENYSAANALQAAAVVLANQTKKIQGEYKTYLQVCTPKSLANALRWMVVNKWDPAKEQCYFILKYDRLECQASYFGLEADILKHGVLEVRAQEIYKSDDFGYEMDDGRITNISHHQDLSNKESDPIVGGYAVIKWQDDRDDWCELMSSKQILESWGETDMGETRKLSDPHASEFVKKTVAKRACKRFRNTSSDVDIFKTKDEEISIGEESLEREVAEEANSESIDIEYEQEGEEVPKEEKKKSEDVPKSDVPFEEKKGPGF